LKNLYLSLVGEHAERRKDMKTVTYTFCNGTVSEAVVSDELYAVVTEMVQEEKRNHKRETRRHVSLDYLHSKGIDFEAHGTDPLTVLIKREDEARLREAIRLLSDKQRELVEKVFFNGTTVTEIAAAEGVDRTAISHRLSTVYGKLKKLL
jgi:RNA polymerase sigma-70 factor (ECF subfamily)